VLLEAWLKKRAVSAVLFKNWQRRLLWLRSDRIEWRSWRDGVLLRAGALRLSPSTVATACKIRAHSVSVTTDGRTLVVQCASDAEQGTWLDEIRSAVGHRRCGAAETAHAPRRLTDADELMHEGSPIVVHSMKTRPELNGRKGVAKYYSDQRKRWAVHLDGDTEPCMMLAKNVKALGLPITSQPPAACQVRGA
jgi:hypothetical protein